MKEAQNKLNDQLNNNHYSIIFFSLVLVLSFKSPMEDEEWVMGGSTTHIL